MITPVSYATDSDALIRSLTTAELAKGLACGPLDLAMLNAALKLAFDKITELDGHDNAVTGASYDAATNTLTFVMADGPSVAIDMSGVLADFVASADASYVTPAELAAALAGVSAVPSGLISMWTGSVAPAGWALCDGSNGTPDLRDKFVIGAGGSHVGGATGGADTHNHGGVTGDHALTVGELPAHDHALFVPGSVGDIGAVGAGQPVAVQTNSSPGESEYIMRPLAGMPSVGISGQTGAGDVHSHTIANASNLPPFYALAFIMKL